MGGDSSDSLVKAIVSRYVNTSTQSIVVRWLSEITVHWRTKAPNFACSFTLTFSTILA